MKSAYGSNILLLLVVLAWLSPLHLPAQSHALFPRLKGIGVSDVPGPRTGVKVLGNFAYLTFAGGTNSPGGLEVFSITNPATPLRMGRYESSSPANALQVAGHYAFLALGAKQTITNDTGAFEIVDVNDPANPVRVAQTNTLSRANDVCVAGNYAFIAESSRWTGSNLLGALEIFDISTPTNPLRVATLDTLGSAASVDVSGNFAYLCDSVTDVQVLNINDPSDPMRVGSYRPDLSQCAFEPLGGPANYVQVIGNVVYSSGDHGLNVLDISNPAQPIRIQHNSCVPIQSLHVAGNLRFMVMFHSLLSDFILWIADTADPTNSVMLGMREHWPPARMQVMGSLIYLATNPLLIYELTDRPMIQSISQQLETIRLTWDYAPGFVLQRAASLADPSWAVVPGSADQNSIELQPSGGNEFFRLARP